MVSIRPTSPTYAEHGVRRQEIETGEIERNHDQWIHTTLSCCRTYVLPEKKTLYLYKTRSKTQEIATAKSGAKSYSAYC